MDNPPADQVYTDGCGFINGAALLAISRQVGYPEPPVAVQGRILGSKGVWILHYTDRLPAEEPKIWIRNSQVKINLTEGGTFNPEQLQLLEPSHLIFDLVQPSKVSKPARLGRHTLMNLSHNGVSTDLIETLMRESLEKEITPFLQWTGPNAMPLLWDTVNKAGRVSLVRLQRRAAGISRALGLSRRPFNEESSESSDSGDESEEPETPVASTPPVVVPTTSIIQDSLSENVLRMIQAGFTPLENFELYTSLGKLVKIHLESAIKEYHIVLENSADAFIIPGELTVSIRFSDFFNLLCRSMECVGGEPNPFQVI